MSELAILSNNLALSTNLSKQRIATNELQQFLVKNRPYVTNVMCMTWLIRASHIYQQMSLLKTAGDSSLMFYTQARVNKHSNESHRTISTTKHTHRGWCIFKVVGWDSVNRCDHNIIHFWRKCKMLCSQAQMDIHVEVNRHDDQNCSMRPDDQLLGIVRELRSCIGSKEWQERIKTAKNNFVEKRNDVQRKILSARQRQGGGRRKRQGADLTRKLLECLPAWPIVPSSAVSPSIITACYPS